MDCEWEVRLSREAERELSGLPTTVQREAAVLIDELIEDPFPPGLAQMKRYDRTFRIRFGGDRYRMLFRFDAALWP